MKAIIENLRAWGADIDGAMGRFLDDEEFYIDCLNRFVQDANILRLKKAVENGNRAEIFEASHALKGTTGTLGLNPLYQTISILVEDSRFLLKDTVKNDYDTFTMKYQEFNKLIQGA